MVSVSCYC